MTVQAKEPIREKVGALELDLSFDRSGLRLTPGPLGLVVELAGCKSSGLPGGPSLPSRIVRLALPPRTRVARISSRSSDPVAVGGDPVHVAPAQPPPADSDEPLPPRIEPPRPELYEREAGRAGEIARLIGTRQIGPVQIASIEVRPVRLGGDRKLSLVEKAEIAVHFQADEGPAGGSRNYSKTQARRLVELARAQVENPGIVSDFSRQIRRRDIDVDYLVITDNHVWNETTLEPEDPVDGDIVASFEQLAEWKEQRGLRCRLVTVGDIVDGVYGDFRSNARDLQEVLRNFLKWAYAQWGVAWVLLGGDVTIIPVREVAGTVDREGVFIDEDSVDPPGEKQFFWDEDERCLKMHMTTLHAEISTDDRRNYPLVHPVSGVRIPHVDDDWDGSGPALPLRPYQWHFTDETYGDPWPGIPDGEHYYVRIDVAPWGDESKVRGSLQWLYRRNLLATDLYYADLGSPGAPEGQRAPAHDWDANSNRVYAQSYAWSEDAEPKWADHDGVPLQADLSVGRAPVKTGGEAENFVNKVIRYEKFERADGTTPDTDWPQRVLVCSGNWVHRSHIAPMDDPSVCPPDEGRYCRPDPNLSLIRFGAWETDLQLIAQVTGSEVGSTPDLRHLPYYFDVYGNAGERGWHFAVSADDLSPSAEEHPFPPDLVVHVPVPTEWIVVHGEPDDLEPEEYLFDKYGPDKSMQEQEELRKQVAQELPQFQRISRLYEDDIDLPAADVDDAPLEHLAKGSLVDALEWGPHFVSYAGHGSHLASGLLPESVTSGLESRKQPFIGYADACWTGDFDWEHSGKSCLGERLLNRADHGAVAHVGSARYSWTRIGDDFQRAFFHALGASRHLGVLHDSRLICPSLESTSEAWAWMNRKIWTIFALNLLGDPEMPVWDRIPFNLVPVIPEVLDPDALSDGIWEVTVAARNRDGTEPLAGATVHVRGRDFRRTAVTDRAGRARIRLIRALRGELLTTVSCPGYVPVSRRTRIQRRTDR